MTDQDANNSGKVPKPDSRSSQAETGAGFSCCGPEMTEAAAKCPCASMFKKHPLAGLGIFSVMLLMFLVSQVGGILGIIAFFRTL